MINIDEKFLNLPSLPNNEQAASTRTDILSQRIIALTREAHRAENDDLKAQLMVPLKEAEEKFRSACKELGMGDQAENLLIEIKENAMKPSEGQAR